MTYPVLWMNVATDDETLARLRLPGVKVTKRVGFSATLRCAFTAGEALAPVMAYQMQQGRLRVDAARWTGARPSRTPWQVIERALRPHVAPFVLAEGYLTPYQREALEVSWLRPGAGLWHPTGSGKTLVATLLALRTPKLKVVLTRAGSRLQFGYEICRFTRYVPYVLLPPTERRPPRKGATGAVRAVRELAVALEPEAFIEAHPDGFFVAAWDHIAEVYNLLVKMKPAVGAIVFDEAHRAKNHKRWDVLALSADEVEQARVEARERGGFVTEDEDGPKLIVPKGNASSYAARLAKFPDWRVCATATPTKDRARDLFAQADLLDPGGFGTATEFLDRYADRRVDERGYMDTKGSSNEAELQARLRLVVHQIDSSVTQAQLPARRRVVHMVQAEDQVRAIGDDAEERRMKKSAGTSLLEYHLMRAASRKRRAVRDLVTQHVGEGHKVVIFTGRRSDCDTLCAEVRRTEGLQVWAAHGGMPATLRQEVAEDYMAHQGPCVLVATGQSMGESINLQDTDVAIFAMLPWTPGDLVQWEGRFSRLGQKRPVLLYYTVAEDSVDERVISILLDKMGQVAKLAPDTQVDNIVSALSGEADADRVLDRLAAYFSARGDIGVGDDAVEEQT